MILKTAFQKFDINSVATSLNLTKLLDVLCSVLEESVSQNIDLGLSYFFLCYVEKLLNYFFTILYVS